MLIELAIANFRSIQDEQRLSLVAGSGKEHWDTNVLELEQPNNIGHLLLLRSAAIYGPNAAGKSNLIKALSTMQRIVLTSHQQLAQIPVVPFLFDPENRLQPTLFEVVVMAEGVRYQYGFRATTERIHDEWLFAFPKGRSQRWFERSYDPNKESDEFAFGDKLTGDKEIWRRATRPNALFLSTAIQLNSRQLQPLFNWFADRLRITGVNGWAPHFSIKWCRSDNKKRILEFLQAADFAIADLRVEEEDFGPERLPSNMPHPLRQFLEYQFKGGRRYKMFTGHRTRDGEWAELDLEDESDGTQKMFSFAGPWLDSLARGRVLFVDELHDNLHPILVRFLVQLFHSAKTNPKGAQLVFTTHETSILNQECFRRDQIWFCERDRRQSTQLYPLTDFSPRKGIENLERAYLAGRYGALPFLSDLSEVFEGQDG